MKNKNLNITYNDIVEHSQFLQAWDGLKGFKYEGVRIATSNRYIASKDLTQAINTSVVKQVYLYDNNLFKKLVKNGFHIKHRLSTILFYKDKNGYYLASENKKTKEITVYEINENTILNESDIAIQVPLLNLIKMLKIQPIIK